MQKLNKHFLLAVSDDASLQYGARFLGYFFHNKGEIRVDMLNIAYNPQKTMAEPGDPTPHQTTQMQHASLEKGKLALQSAREKLEGYGFAEDSLKTDLKMQTFSTVHDLVSYGRKGLYDSLVLGHRGIGMLESLVQDSISSKLLHQECEMPLWICREPVRAKKDILICTDGSEASLGAADHAGFILAGEPEHDITVLHVAGSGSQADREKIINSTVDRLLDNNIDQKRITAKSLDRTDTARTILDYARENSFAVIAMGRTERHKSPGRLGRFFMGSVSEKVFKNFRQASLWIHH
ncbi:UspA domain protein [Desulfonatronospira thiodismutans ASO3-1]|uniref:UspA domain protein n=1 Tax=Desulfonatronospira thiodismutans ASO3-1 TaxID=555779 RepID=D6SSL4_9BACT|nr:universal stress protein [Desulfonatronospira thiodismutans]EFI33680.1 UspA domain protein [Desulfonatronospira thiodismutans ASO3-1]